MNVICLLDDDESTTHSNENRHGKRVKSVVSNAVNGDDGDDDEVEVLDMSHVSRPITTSTYMSNNNENNGGEELEIVGATNVTLLPHNRQDCLAHRYVSQDKSGKEREDNASFCGLCYCYVCDRPAGECSNWSGGRRGVFVDEDATAGAGLNGGEKDGSSSVSVPNPMLSGSGSSQTTYAITPDAMQSHKNHCQATDRGPNSFLWRNMRRAVKEGQDPATVTTIPRPSDRTQREIIDIIQKETAEYQRHMHCAMNRRHRILEPPFGYRDKNQTTGQSGSIPTSLPESAQPAMNRRHQILEPPFGYRGKNQTTGQPGSITRSLPESAQPAMRILPAPIRRSSSERQKDGMSRPQHAAQNNVLEGNRTTKQSGSIPRGLPESAQLAVNRRHRILEPPIHYRKRNRTTEQSGSIPTGLPESAQPAMNQRHRILEPPIHYRKRNRTTEQSGSIPTGLPEATVGAALPSDCVFRGYIVSAQPAPMSSDQQASGQSVIERTVTNPSTKSRRGTTETSPMSRRRTRSSSGPHDHRQRIRAQAMLEELYR